MNIRPAESDVKKFLRAALRQRARAVVSLEMNDCKSFLSSPEKWAERGAGLGWNAMALFGCAPKRPLDYSGSAGLLWAINGGRVRGHWATWPCRRVA